MHTSSRLQPRSRLASASLVLSLLASLPSAFAADLYWDTNGATPDTGNTATGNWNGTTANWNDASSGTGGTPTAITGASDDLFFSSGTLKTGAFTVTGSGTQSADSLNFLAGTVTISGGTIAFGTGSSEVGVASGLTATLNANVTGTNGFTKSGAGVLLFGTSNAINNTGLTGVISVKAGALLVGSQTSGTANPINNQTISLGETGSSNAATFSLNRNHNYASTVTVNSGPGIRRLSGGSGLSANQQPSITGAVTLNGDLTLGNGAAGVYTGNNFGGIRLSGVITGAGKITADGNTAFTTPADYTTNIASNLSPTIAKIAADNGTTFTGNVAVERGVLFIENANALGNGTAVVTTASGAALNLNNNSATAKTVNIAGLNNGSVTGGSVSNLGSAIAATAGTATLALKGAGAYSYGGTIIDGTYTGSSVWKVALTVNMAGTQTLAGANTYSGNTTLTTGTLLVNGTHTLPASSTTGAYAINGGILGGTGAIDLSGGNQSVTFASGAKLQASSTDSLTFTLGSGSLDLSAALSAASPSLLFTLGAPGSTVVAASHATFGGGLLNFDDFSFTTGAGFGPGAYTLFDLTSFSGSLGTSLTGTVGGLDAIISLDGNDIILTASAVPEPASAAALGGLVGFAFVVSRRRRQ